MAIGSIDYDYDEGTEGDAGHNQWEIPIGCLAAGSVPKCVGLNSHEYLV